MSEKNQTNSNRGGARKGAGRKAGSATKKTREIADKAIAEGLSPLEFMLNLMRSQAPAGASPEVAMDHVKAQFEAAKAAAPYVHPRLAAVEHSGKDGAPLAPAVINLVRQDG